jgi:YD repeat-containing protein
MSQVSSPYKPGETVVWTVYRYDASGRTTRVAAPDGSATAYAYQGNQTTVTDAAGKWKKYTTDAMGNLSQVTEPNPAGGADLVTTYSYDALNHMTQVTMPRQQAQQTRTFTYDSFTQRLTAVQTPESGTVTYVYNPDGTVQSKTDAKQQTTRYTYEPYGRVSQTDAYPAGANQPDLCQRVTYDYDFPTVAAWGPYTNGFGRLVRMRWSSPVTQMDNARSPLRRNMSIPPGARCSRNR